MDDQWNRLLHSEIRNFERKRLLAEWLNHPVEFRRLVYAAVATHLLEDLGYALADKNRSPDPRLWSTDFLMRCIEASRDTLVRWEASRTA